MGFSKGKKDLLLAKRRVLVVSPFLIIDFAFSIVMIVFSGITLYRLIQLRDDYKIGENDYTYYNNKEECINTKKSINLNQNFTKVFEIIKKESKYPLLNSVEGCLGYSIAAVVFDSILLLFLFFFICIYVRPSDEKIKSNISHVSNKNHCVTLIFFILKCITYAYMDFHLIKFFIYSISDRKILKNVFDFYENCVIEKEKFKKNYSYCWEINGPLNKYYIFMILFIIADIISIILTILAQNYNVWGLLLYLITFGKYEYKKVDANLGFVIPPNSVNKDDEKIDDLIVGSVNDNEEKLK